MHELSIVQGLLEAACDQARDACATRVNRLACRIGVLRQVDDELLRAAFEIARDGTLCAQATLDVEKRYMRANCPQCAQTFEVRGWDWRCPACGGEGEALCGGDELELVSIDAEVPA